MGASEQAVSNALVTLILAYKVFSKSISLGDFVALSNGISRMTNNLSGILQIIPDLYEHSLYIDRFRNFINYKPMCRFQGDKYIDTFENVKLCHVSFRYPNSFVDTLDNININIEKGEKIAIVGLNGAGKSTIIKLILGLYVPNGGEIYLNNISYSLLDFKVIRQIIGVTFQDYHVYATSIVENVLLRPIVNKKDDEACVIDALKRVGLYEKIARLPEGIYTNITKELDKDGIVLSGGEQQKLSIARILSRNYKFIILDEPSSSLDPIAENEFFETFIKDAKLTLVMISHRLSNICKADRIYLIDKGRISEEGSHNELMSYNGKYAQMFEMQACHYKC